MGLRSGAVREQMAGLGDYRFLLEILEEGGSAAGKQREVMKVVLHSSTQRRNNVSESGIHN